MTPYCLRFPSEATGLTALEAAGLLDPITAFPITASLTHALDVLGPIYRGGSWNPETGEVITAPTLLDGWHANFIGELPDGWEEFVVTPQNPIRVWAGSAPPEPTPDVDEAWVAA
jgi:hypothetical protein